MAISSLVRNYNLPSAIMRVAQQTVRSKMAVDAASQHVTNRTYYFDTYQEEVKAKVLSSGQDDDGAYFIPDHTVFHPQGGGQPSDKGTATIGGETFNVIKLTEDGKAIKHYVDDVIVDDPTGLEVVLKIDLEARKLFARIHSAGHLLSDVVHQEFPELTGYRGNHFPNGQSFVVFSGPMPDKAAVKEKLEPALNRVIAEDQPVTTHNGEGTRKVEMPGFAAVPCGGTHVTHTGEIGKVEIRSIKHDKGPGGQKELKVGYNISGQA